MNSTVLLVIVAVIIVLLVAWNKIKSNKAGSVIQSGALIIDVRTPQEFESGHFSTAINIPHDQIERRIKELGDDKNKPIVLYCHAGSRASIAAEVLKRNGFVNVVNAGGYSDIRRFDKK